MKYLIILSILCLCSCDFRSENKEDGSIQLYGNGTTQNIRSIILDDGTRCVVMIGPNRGGISCDFSTTKH